MFFEDPLEMPFRIAGSPGDGFNVQAAIKVVVDPVEQIVNECTRVHLASLRHALKASLFVALKGGPF